MISKNLLRKMCSNFPGGPLVKNPLSNPWSGMRVQSLVRELRELSSHMFWANAGAATKTQCSQINKIFFFKENMFSILDLCFAVYFVLTRLCSLQDVSSLIRF